jgi:alpha,alpha-trehalase
MEREKGFESIITYLPHLEREYGYWMDAQSERVIRLENENSLNRYWDARNLPREEAHRQDIELFERAGAKRQTDIYRNLRAGAESGWDFSSRWLDESRALESIRTTDILPVDLNCLLYGMERQMGAWFTKLEPARAIAYLAVAEQRKNAIQKYCWNAELGWFFDYSWRDGKQTQIWSLAGLYPLYCGLADQQQARIIAQHTREKFLKPGGVVTTLNETGQQWDSPNGWAPLQWITVQGLLDYDQKPLAVEIARRFINLAESVYQSTGKMMEKYNVCRLDLEAGGGEYPLQDGFGWTNGVVRCFMELLSISP